MNVLLPTRFNGYMEQGGSTRPWKVFLQDAQENEVPYVVKLFTTRNIEQQHAVAKEVYANVLAREFSLPVPEIALVRFTEEFIQYALEDSERDTLSKKDPGLKFASRLEDRMTIVSPTLYKKYLKDYDMGNVFAFDCLAFNLDRGGERNKPNLLVDDENFMLIDHEQTFPFANRDEPFFYKVLEKFENDEIMYPFQKHLLYPYLKEMRTQDKKHLFDEFGEYLARLNTDNIELTIKLLVKLGVSTGQYDFIIHYLRRLQQNPHKFCNILLSCIS